MVYKERIVQLLEALNMKVQTLERAMNGTIGLSNNDVNKIIGDIKQLTERVTNLIENER